MKLSYFTPRPLLLVAVLLQLNLIALVAAVKLEITHWNDINGQIESFHVFLITQYFKLVILYFMNVRQDYYNILERHIQLHQSTGLVQRWGSSELHGRRGKPRAPHTRARSRHPKLLPNETWCWERNRWGKRLDSQHWLGIICRIPPNAF